MGIVFDKELGHMVDEETGEYLTSDMISRDEQEYDYTIRDKDGNPIFGAMVQEIAIDETGNSEGATVVYFKLRQTWMPKVEPQHHRVYFDGSHPQIEKLAAFLRASLRAGGIKTPDPRFEFIDERSTYFGSRAGEL